MRAAQAQPAADKEAEVAQAADEATAEEPEQLYDEALASQDPRELLSQMLAEQDPALRPPTLRQRLRAMAPLLPRGSAVLRAIKRIGVLRDEQRGAERVMVLDANTEWDLRRRIAGSRRLGRVEFTGMSPAWSVLIEDAIEPPKVPPEISDALKEEVRRVVESVPAGYYVMPGTGWIARRLHAPAAAGGEAMDAEPEPAAEASAEGPVAMEVSA
ncbi:hypothetical protein DFJ74DRAFT_648408 [Hyaloraphidium curvatum]|nr:hypothetical protein DFJ74DRAFT_648408 [Hyaloraphidium curvatum]